MPDFRDKVRGGQQVVVGGRAFGVGSSRENAPQALKGKYKKKIRKPPLSRKSVSTNSFSRFAGLNVKCVIARSFAFIYARNQPNLGLLGIVIDDDEFHRLATDGVDIEVDLDAREVRVAGKIFGFKLDDMELALVENKGMSAAYKRFGKQVFEKLTGNETDSGVEMAAVPGQEPEHMKGLTW